MRNIELKARLNDRAKALTVCAQIGAVAQGDIRQTDTFFRVPEGRFKLRECSPGNDYLVFYRRADVAQIKGCDYLIEPCSPSLKRLLAAALDPIGEIRKVRSLWLWRNVRIHLDEVVDLGSFIEFEAVLSDEYDDADGHAKLKWLCDTFTIADDDLLTGAYLDLLLAGRPDAFCPT